MNVCANRKVQTFEQWHLLARDYLRQHPEYPRYTALFVDEAQDFSKVARQLCIELVADPRHLLLAADTGQSIYTMPVPWSQCDPRLNFQARRPIRLIHSYRTTRQISQAIASLHSDPGDEVDRSPDAKPVFSGPQPCWIDAPLTDHPRIVAERIDGLVRDNANPVHAGQIAIIIRESRRVGPFANQLQNHGIDCSVVNTNTPLQVDRAQIHIITAHSSKGLGFPVVFVPDVSAAYYPWQYLLNQAADQEQREEIEAKEQRLLYVALSRASHQLYMVVDSGSPSPFLGKLDRNTHWDQA
jgi:superfamily I DNA/RNA helicase